MNPSNRKTELLALLGGILLAAIVFWAYYQADDIRTSRGILGKWRYVAKQPEGEMISVWDFRPGGVWIERTNLQEEGKQRVYENEGTWRVKNGKLSLSRHEKALPIDIKNDTLLVRLEPTEVYLVNSLTFQRIANAD